jgi:preprotein translocase subunit SecD
MRTLPYLSAALLFIAGCDTMKNSPHPLAKTATLELYVVSSTQTPDTKQATDPDTNAPIFLTMPAIISAADVTTIQRFEDAPQRLSLDVHLSAAGAKKLEAATADPTVKRIAVVANGTVISAPKVRASMSTGFRVSGSRIQEQLFEALTKN